MSIIHKRRNKAYRPSAPDPLGGISAIARKHFAAEDARPLKDADQTDLGVAYWMAFRIMTTADSGEEDWTMIVVSLNTALVLCERGIGNEFEPYLVRALDGAFRARLRADRTGVWRFDGDALCAIREALEVHDEQIKIATKEEIRLAIAEVMTRVATGQTYKEAA